MVYSKVLSIEVLGNFDFDKYLLNGDCWMNGMINGRMLAFVICQCLLIADSRMF